MLQVKEKFACSISFIWDRFLIIHSEIFYGIIYDRIYYQAERVQEKRIQIDIVYVLNKRKRIIEENSWNIAYEVNIHTSEVSSTYSITSDTLQCSKVQS